MNIPLNKFEDWLRSKDLKERTIENYIYYFNKFTNPVFNQESVAKFLSDKTNRNSISRSFLSNVRKFMKVSYKELGFSPEKRLEISEVELPKLTGRSRVKRIKPLTGQEILLLEKNLDNEKERLQLIISYKCGLRLGELLKIRILDFNILEWSKDRTDYGKCFVRGKGDKEGIALVPPDVMTRVEKYIWDNIKNNIFKSQNPLLFVNTDDSNNLRHRGRNWQRKLRQAGVDSGITPVDENKVPIAGTIVHPHRLRHSYANYLLNERNFSLEEVQELLRHTSITSTQVYAQIDKVKLMKKLKE